MLSFAAELPLNNATSIESLAVVVRKWIIGSRHSRFRGDALDGLGIGDSWVAIEADELVESLREKTADGETMAIVYRKQDPDFDWITTVVFSAGQSCWVSVRVECEPRHPRAQVPTAKKPVLMRLLLEELGGGVDGEFRVSGQPVVFAPSEVMLAAQCILGQADCYLPIVYVSASFSGHYLVDPHELASSLAGMAHVVVEPSRDFSVQLMAEAQRKNVYGGAVALYWPEGGGRRTFFTREKAGSPTEAQQQIVEEVRLSLIHRRPLPKCTISAVKELKSRRLINSLKDEGSKEVQTYVDLFEEELRAKEDALTAAELEIGRLKAEIRRFETIEGPNPGLMLNLGTEHDLSEGEILDTVMEAVHHAVECVTPNGRRQHILKALAAANPVAAERNRLREQVKLLLRNYQSMDSRIRRELEQIGFSVDESGKHIKLTYHNDERYIYILPKTSSDHRAGMNSAGDICRLFF